MSLQTEIHFANTGPQSEICVFVFFTVFLKEGKFLVQTKSSSLLFFLMEYAFLCVINCPLIQDFLPCFLLEVQVCVPCEFVFIYGERYGWRFISFACGCLVVRSFL